LLPEANRADPATFNVCMGSYPDAVFSYRDDNLNVIISWLPYPNLIPGTRQRVINAVSLLPRAWLVQPIEVEVFNSAQARRLVSLGILSQLDFRLLLDRARQGFRGTSSVSITVRSLRIIGSLRTQ